MARELPRYLWDVLADIVEYEDQHGNSHQCLAGTLDRLPSDVRTGAEVIARYREKKLERGFAPAPGGQP